MATTLTKETHFGWHESRNGSTRDNPGGKRNPYIWSSDSWLAFEAGQMLAEKGYTEPVKATKSRGFSVRIWTQSNEFLFKASGDDLEITDLFRK